MHPFWTNVLISLQNKILVTSEVYIEGESFIETCYIRGGRDLPSSNPDQTQLNQLIRIWRSTW